MQARSGTRECGEVAGKWGLMEDGYSEYAALADRRTLTGALVAHVFSIIYTGSVQPVVSGHSSMKKGAFQGVIDIEGTFARKASLSTDRHPNRDDAAIPLPVHPYPRHRRLFCCVVNGINSHRGRVVRQARASQPHDELLDPRHPQANVVSERAAREQVHVNSHRRLAVVSFHS